MILCANPWYNEPGRREGTQKKDAEDFSNRVRVNNIKWAMLDWLKDGEKKNGIWKVRSIVPFTSFPARREG
jgi:baculoviral IAP repeat-containing protein 6